MIIIGIITGLITGLFGAGGGILLIPAFVKLLNINEKESRATAIPCILVGTIISFIFYFKEKMYDTKLGILCSIGGIIGALIGSKLLNKLNDNILKIIFIIFLGYTSFRYIYK